MYLEVCTILNAVTVSHAAITGKRFQVKICGRTDGQGKLDVKETEVGLNLKCCLPGLHPTKSCQ